MLCLYVILRGANSIISLFIILFFVRIISYLGGWIV